MLSILLKQRSVHVAEADRECLCVCTIRDVEEAGEFILGCRNPFQLAEMKQADRETLQLIVTEIHMR